LVGLGALGYFLQSLFYFNAIRYSPVAVVALLLYTYPAFVTICSLALGWEKISMGRGGAVILALIGLVLVVNPSTNVIGLGVLLALAAAITYTIYILASSSVIARVQGEVAFFYISGFACLSFGLLEFATGSTRFTWTPLGWLWVSMIAVVGTAAAATMFFLGLSRIGPSMSSLISLVEPVASTLFSLVILGEIPRIMQWIGGALILISIACTAVSRHSYLDTTSAPRKRSP